MTLNELALALGIPPFSDGRDSSHTEQEAFAALYTVDTYSEEMLELFTDPSVGWAEQGGDVVIQSSADGKLMVSGLVKGARLVSIRSLGDLADTDTWPMDLYPTIRRKVMATLKGLKA